jgi:DNA repair photolyase
MIGPVIPGLTDHEIPSILAAAKQAGARYAGFVVLRLPHGVGDLFERWLEQYFPEKKDKVLHRVEEMHRGKRNDSDFGTRMRGTGPLADMIEQMFKRARRQEGLEGHPTLSAAAFRRPGETPTLLFE